MRHHRARLLTVSVCLAAGLSLVLLSCDVNGGTHEWKIGGHATFTYPGPLPIPSGDVTLVMKVTRNGQPVWPGEKTWSGSFTNGELDIPVQKIYLDHDVSFYTYKVVWALTTINGGMCYADTEYFFPFLVIKDPAERVWTMEFVIHEQPPD